MRRGLNWILLLAAVGACGGERAGAGRPSGVPGIPSPTLSATTERRPQLVATEEYERGPRPEEKHATIRMEGFDEPFTLRLFRAPDDFPLQFSTYFPPDMLAEVTREPAPGVSFVANFAGKRNDNAVLRVVFEPAGTIESAAKARARRAAAERGMNDRADDTPRRFAWSLAEYDFAEQTSDGEQVGGTVAVGRHGDRYFQVLLMYPDEYGDGMGPRVARILDEWRWQDGAPLGK